MKLIKQIKDKAKRHKERHQASEYQYIISDSIKFTNINDWMKVAEFSSVFLSPDYLSAIESCSPENTKQIYAMAYKNGVPVVIVACQIAEILDLQAFRRLLNEMLEGHESLARRGNRMP